MNIKLVGEPVGRGGMVGGCSFVPESGMFVPLLKGDRATGRTTHHRCREGYLLKLHQLCAKVCEPLQVHHKLAAVEKCCTH